MPIAAMDRGGVIVGLIGSAIQASRSPALHEREAAAQGLKLIYRLIDLDQVGLCVGSLESLIQAAEWMGFAGLNITYPCKQAVLPLLHDMSPDARAIGAVNTIVLKDGRRTGHNTDVSGFSAAFHSGLADAAHGHVVQLGAGGGGAAVAHALLAEGVERLSLHDIDAARSERLARSLCARFGNRRAEVSVDLAAEIAAADGLVNCTPVGMAKLPGMPLAETLLRPALWVADIVYFPLETALLRAARSLGCRTLDGGGMAVFQAVGAFKLFTGLAADTRRMRRHFAEMTAAEEGRAPAR